MSEISLLSIQQTARSNVAQGYNLYALSISIVFTGVVTSTQIKCRDVWIPISIFIWAAYFTAVGTWNLYKLFHATAYELHIALENTTSTPVGQVLLVSKSYTFWILQKRAFALSLCEESWPENDPTWKAACKKGLEAWQSSREKTIATVALVVQFALFCVLVSLPPVVLCSK